MWIPISLLLQFCYGYNMLHNRYMFSLVKNLMDRCENLMKWHYFELVIPDLQYKITTETEFGRNFVVKKARETVSVLMIITPLVKNMFIFHPGVRLKMNFVHLSHNRVAFVDHNGSTAMLLVFVRQWRLAVLQHRGWNMEINIKSDSIVRQIKKVHLLTPLVSFF